MNKDIRRFFLIAFCAIVIFACNKSDSSKDCSTGPAAAIAPSKGQVNYFVNLQGGGHITSVVFQSVTGPVTLANPLAPWTASFFVDSGTVLTINAVGSGTTGMSAGYKFVSGGNVLIDSASCTP